MERRKIFISNNSPFFLLNNQKFGPTVPLLTTTVVLGLRLSSPPSTAAPSSTSSPVVPWRGPRRIVSGVVAGIVPGLGGGEYIRAAACFRLFPAPAPPARKLMPVASEMILAHSAASSCDVARRLVQGSQRNDKNRSDFCYGIGLR